MFLENVKHYLFQIEEILLLLGAVVSLAFYIALTARRKYSELMRPENKTEDTK